MCRGEQGAAGGGSGGPSSVSRSSSGGPPPFSLAGMRVPTESGTPNDADVVMEVEKEFVGGNTRARAA